MQNPLSFYPDYNPYVLNEDFPSNGPDLSVESDVFSSPSSIGMSAAHMPISSQPNPSAISTAKKRKTTADTETSFSPASIYSENSTCSDSAYPTFARHSFDLGQGSSSSARSGRISNATGATPTNTASNLTTSAEEGSSDDNDDGEEETNLARKREKHTQVEAQRRALEKAHFRELSLLITDRSDTKSTKLHHLDLLKIAADRITEMNARHKHDPLRPSNLTDSELNFLTIEASNSFIFVTTMEPAIFRIIHVTDSINRILNLSAEQWRRQNFFSFVHRDDQMRVQSQLMSLNSSVGMKIHLECRLKQGQTEDQYSSVIIDGMTKRIDQSLRPVPNNAPGYLAFIGICHVPLITKYSETNMSLYQNPQTLTFRCRCSPHDWKIFLVDRSVSTLKSVSHSLFLQKSILDFIRGNDQPHVHQVLLRSTTASINETIACDFIHPTLHTSIPMSVEIKSFFNPILHRADFIELTFKNSTPLMIPKIDPTMYEFYNDSKAIDDLLASEPTSASNQAPLIQPLHGNSMNSTTQNVPYFYPSDWPTKHEHFWMEYSMTLQSLVRVNFLLSIHLAVG